MSVTSITELLRDHIGHRTTLVEPAGTGLAIKCLSCSRLLDLSVALGLRPSTARPTSTSTHTPLNVNDPNACPTHPGEPATHCGRCRSEHLGDQAPPVAHTRTGTDPTHVPEWQAARQRLAQLSRSRPVSPPKSTLSTPDPSQTEPTASSDAQPTASDGGTA